MRENSLGPGIAFAAENFIAIDGESIEKILRLGRRLLDKGRERSFDRREFSWMRFKVRVNTNEVRRKTHIRTLYIEHQRVETSDVLSPQPLNHPRLNFWFPLFRFRFHCPLFSSTSQH